MSVSKSNSKTSGKFKVAEDDDFWNDIKNDKTYTNQYLNQQM